MIKTSPSRKIFLLLNTLILLFAALICILPLVHLAAVSFSDSAKAEAGLVGLLPVKFTLQAYQFIFSTGDFFRAFFNSCWRLLLGVPLNMMMTFLAAYPLSRPNRYLRWRSFYSWFFIITMLFSGGMIPLYMLVSALHLTNTIWALILPGAVPVFNVVLMINFFRQVPEEFYEAAVIDGSSEWNALFKIYIPLALPSVITILLFVLVAQWNSWFDGIIYMNEVSKYPLQSYLQAVVINKLDLASIGGQLDLYKSISQQTVDAARLFLATVPIIAVYLPLQKYFIKGLTLGGVKG